MPGRQRAHDSGLRLCLQHCRRAAGMVVVGMAEYQPIDLLVECRKQRHQNALPGIAAVAVACAGVVQQAVARRADQHCAALPDVHHQQFELARCRPHRLPQQHRREPHQPLQAPGKGQAYRQQQAAGKPCHSHPQRCQGCSMHGPGPGSHPFQHGIEQLQQVGCQQPQGRQQHTKQGQRRDQHRDQRHRQHVGQHPGNGELAEHQHGQRREREHHHPLLVQKGADGMPDTCAPMGGRRRLLVARDEQHGHRNKTQPEPRLQQRPGIQQRDCHGGHRPDRMPGPLLATAAQQGHHQQHAHRALRRHAPAGKPGIKQCQQHAAPQPGLRRRQPQAQGPLPPGTAPPCPPHQASGQPGKHRHMQPRNAHQMGHPGAAEDVPVLPLDGRLIAHHQGGEYACNTLAILCCRSSLPGRSHMVEQTLAHLQARTIHGKVQPVPWCIVQALRCLSPRGCPHLPAGTHFLLPHPQFQIEAERIAVAVRLTQTHGELPALPRLHAAGTGAPGGRRRRRSHLPARRPAQRQTARYFDPLVPPAGLFHGKLETGTICPPLRQALHRPGHHQFVTIQLCRQTIPEPVQGALTCDGKRQHGQHHIQPCWRRQHRPHMRNQQQDRDACQHQILRPLPQRRLLQLQRNARHPGHPCDGERSRSPPFSRI